MNYNKKTRNELISICKEVNIKGYSGKNKQDIINLIETTSSATSVTTSALIDTTSFQVSSPTISFRLDKNIRYIGCKQKLLARIHECVLKCTENIEHRPCVLFDAFSGTGTVSSHFSENGFKIISCDILSAASLLTKCKVGITKQKIQFRNLVATSSPNTIERVLSILNDLPGEEGYITTTYTPIGNRMYFTTANGKKIDAIRRQIDSWFKATQITQDEHDFLLGCLLNAVSLVSNTAGTYGAYNKKWDKRAEKPITLENCFHLGDTSHTVLHGNVIQHLDSHECDILYIDPPYNERQYGSYYHLLETIVRNDNPDVKGVTGVRDCSDVKSDFCNKKRIESALSTLLKSAKATFVIMSYNNEGLLSKDKIIELMNKYGEVHCEEIPYERYNRVKDKGSDVVEYLFTLRKTITIPASVVESGPAVATWHNKLFNIDCIEGMKLLPDKSIDLILTDLPYGLTECKWDSVIPLADMWDAYKRVIKPNGAIILFAQQPFSSMLVSSNLEMFKYSLVWKKTKTGNFAQAPYRFLCEHEDILVFSYGKVSKNGQPRMKYFPQGTKDCHIKMKGKNGNTAHREGRAIQKDYVQTTTNYPRSILDFGNEGKPLHPTQKPVDICEYLIRSYTEEGDVVLDSCMGACTTAVAAITTNRIYVGYEKEKEYYDIGLKRIKQICDASA
jgi:site-specific DNA-methyltransferase (adenine-specific)